MTEEKAFRVLLDLSQLGSNYSRYVWMNISPRELYTIADLKSAVSRKLNLDRKDLKLFIHDGLLPDEEKIIILRDNDTVKVCNEDLSRSIHSSSNSSVFFLSRASDPDCTCHNAEIGKKRKRHQSVILNVSDEYDSDNATAKKKKKHKATNGDTNEANIQNISDEYDSNNTTTKKQKKQKATNGDENEASGSKSDSNHSKTKDSNSNDLAKKSKKKSSHKSKVQPEIEVVECIGNAPENEVFHEIEVIYPQNLSEQEWIPIPSEHEVVEQSRSEVKSSSLETEPEVEPVVINDKTVVLHSNSCRKKRKRHKKRKSMPSTIDFLIPESGNETTNTDSFLSTNGKHFIQPPTEKFSCIRKHIRFDSPSPCNSVDVMELDSYLKRFKSGNTDGLSKISEGSSLPSSPVNPIRVSDQRSSTPALKKIVKHTSWSLSPMSNAGAVQSSEKAKEINSTENKKNCKIPLENYPMLKTMPPIGAHIAYKVLELDENYSPVVSSYKEGIVKSIEGETEKMEIELIQEEIIPGRTGKFENLKDDEVPEEQVLTSVTINWPNLIDPVFISG